MKLHTSLFGSTVALILFSTSAAMAGLTVNAPIDVIGSLSSSDFSAYGYGTHRYKDWGNEPSVAVNPLNPNDILVSSFAYGTSSTSAGADIFYSTNGGASFASEFTIPAPAGGVRIPNDWNFAYDSNGVLHGAVLGGCSTCNVYTGTTTDPTSISAWSWANGGSPINTATSLGHADQPWLSVHGSQVAIGYDQFNVNGGSGVQERVAVSTNGGTTFSTDNGLTQAGESFISGNPGTRITTDGNGTIYSIIGVDTPTGTAGVKNVTYYLNYSTDAGATWKLDTAGSPNGLAIDNGVSTQLENAGTQSSNNWFAGVNDLRGNVTAIATDSSGSHVYVLIGKQDGSGIDQIYLATYVRSGSTLLKASEIQVSWGSQRTAIPSVTVLADGTVVIMYDSYDAANNKVDVHIASSSDHGATVVSDVVEYSFTPLTLLAATGSTTANREFGDYATITSIDNTFYATFAGVGNVNGGGIDTTSLIDPFVITGSVTGSQPVPEPSGLALLGTALIGLTLVRRRLL